MTFRSFTSFVEAQTFEKFNDGDEVWIGGNELASDAGAGRFVFRQGATGSATNDRIVVPAGRLLRTSSTDRALDRLATLVAAKIKPDLDDIESKVDAQALAISNMSLNLPTNISTALVSGDPLPVATADHGYDSDWNPLPNPETLESGYVKNTDGQVTSDWFQNSTYRWTRLWTWDANGGFVRGLYARGPRP